MGKQTRLEKNTYCLCIMDSLSTSAYVHTRPCLSIPLCPPAYTSALSYVNQKKRTSKRSSEAERHHWYINGWCFHRSQHFSEVRVAMHLCMKQNEKVNTSTQRTLSCAARFTYDYNSRLQEQQQNLDCLISSLPFFYSCMISVRRSRCLSFVISYMRLSGAHRK